MGFLKNVKEFFLGDEDLIAYKKELKKKYAKKFAEAEMDRKLKDIKNGVEPKKSGLEQFGASLMKASDKIKDYDFQGGSSNNKDYSKDLLK